MIAYLLKSTVCLLLLLVAYHLFLEREKMHRFNRFFLIFSLIFGLTIPLFTINMGSPAQLSQQIDELNSRLTEQPSATMQYAPQTTPETQPTESKVSYFESAVPWLLLFYMIISSVMALRLVRNLYLLWSKIRNNPHVSFGSSILVLVDSDSVPHSFFRYIFVDRQLFQSGNIDEAVLAHEQAHSRQFHSLDIIFIELLKIVFWFNPVLYFYKKAIQTNHEFLADEAVIANSSNVQSYQKLLLKMQSGDPELQLASSIKYSITKKRIIMMTKTTPRFRMICKQLALAPILAGLVFAFSIRTVSAQNVNQMSLTELIDAVNQRLESTESLSSEEQEKLQALMAKMQEKFMPEPPPPPKPDVPAPVPKPKPPKSLLEHLPFKLKAPPPASKEDSAAIAKISGKFNASIREYLEIPATSQNYKRLKSAFEKFSAIQQEYWNTYKTIYKKYEENPPPPPPIIGVPEPENRIKAHSSEPPPTPAKADTSIKQVSQNTTAFSKNI